MTSEPSVHADIALRPPEPGDVEWITRACQDPEIQRWTMVPRPYLPEHAEMFVRNELGSLEPLVVVDGVTGEGLGASGLKSIDPDTGQVESGYWVAPWARGRGVAVAALEHVKERAAAVGGTSLVLLIAPGNVASIKVAERAGFRLAEHRTGGCIDGDRESDTLVYRFELS